MPSEAKFRRSTMSAPEDLRIKELVDRLDREKISEIIFAFSADVEGEATTNYIVDLLKSRSITLPASLAASQPAAVWNRRDEFAALSSALRGRTKL